MGRSAALLLFLGLALPALADDWPQFRGPERTGVSKETGLLQAWPKDGPKLLWTYRDAGLGFSGPSIIGDRMYTMGGWDDGEYLLCIDLKKQKELWKLKVGKLFTYQDWGDGPRGSVTVDGGHVYGIGGYGDLVCATTEGKEVWRKGLASDLGGEMMTAWGYSESPLVDGDWLIVTPGGEKGTLAALNKKNGDVVWRSKELTHKAPFSSVMISNAGGVKQYIQTSYVDADQGGFASGFDAKTGKPLWTENLFKKHSFAIAPTPIVTKDWVYVTAGYEGGCHLFEIKKSGAGVEAKALYDKAAQRTMNNVHGGVVLIDGHIYGHSERVGWRCQELKSGKKKWDDRVNLECASGAIAAADGRLYLFSDSGEAVLLEVSTKEWTEAGRFKLPEESKLRKTRSTLQDSAIWTHPVIANGRLYLRDQELIFCYDVKK